MPLTRSGVSERDGYRSRVTRACDFCRRRKLRCNNAKPRCKHCQTRDVPCVYSERSHIVRPSNVRIQQLEQENNRLREALHRQPIESPTIEPPPETSHTEQGHGRQLLRRPSLDATNDRRVPPAASSTQPLARMSPQVANETSFNSKVDECNGETGGSLDDDVRSKLVGNASRQRQLETFNASSGNLNFGDIDVDLGMELLSLFWNRQYHEGSPVYRSVFMRDMAGGGQYFSEMLLYAILYAASKYTPEDKWSQVRTDPDDPETTGLPFRHKFEHTLRRHGVDSLFQSRITTAQALLIVANVLLSWRDEATLAWHYTGVAINMLVDLGVHSERHDGLSTDRNSPEDLEVYRRTFWAAFILDKIHSIYQGRPPRLNSADVNIPIIFHDDYEELEPFRTDTFTAVTRQLGSPTYAVSTLVELCNVSVLMGKILHQFYSESSYEKSPTELFQACLVLFHDLRRWRAEMPSHLNVRMDGVGTATILPHTLALIAIYNALVILLHRPFVSEGHLQHSSRFIAQEAFSHCVTAADEIQDLLSLYRQHFCLTTVPYFISYATYVSGTIHARVAAVRGPSSRAQSCLTNCLEVLAEQMGKCHAPRRTLKILLQLAKRLGVQVDMVEDRGSGCFRVELGSRQRGEDLVEGCDGMVEAVGSSSQRQAPGVFGPETDGVYSQPLFSDIDIDHIMRSFLVSPRTSQCPQTEAATEGTFLGVMDATPGLVEREGELGYVDRAHVEEPVFSDVIYGYDFAMD